MSYQNGFVDINNDNYCDYDAMSFSNIPVTVLEHFNWDEPGSPDVSYNNYNTNNNNNNNYNLSNNVNDISYVGYDYDEYNGKFLI